jgi:hypothetical protein
MRESLNIDFLIDPSPGVRMQAVAAWRGIPVISTSGLNLDIEEDLEVTLSASMGNQRAKDVQ